MRRGLVLVAAVMVAGLLPGAANVSALNGPGERPASQMRMLVDQGPPPPPVPDPPPATKVLSNERTLSRWAFVQRRVRARKEPKPGSHVVKRLTTSTQDGTQELVLALTWKRLENGAVWVRVRLPMRPNGTKGWVRRGALGSFQVVRTHLIINRRNFVAKLYRNGRRVLKARVGVGKRGTATPVGHFYVRDRLIPADKNEVYGVFAFGTSAFSPTLTDWPGGGIVGVHGTNEPGLIPGRISHGCVRVRNRNILRLKRKMPLGTPIRIR